MQLQQEVDNQPPEAEPEGVDIRPRDVYDRVDYGRPNPLEDQHVEPHNIDDDAEFARRLQELELQGAESDAGSNHHHEDMHGDMPGVWREADYRVGATGQRAGGNDGGANIILIGLRYDRQEAAAPAGVQRNASIRSLRAAPRTPVREIQPHPEPAADPLLAAQALQEQFDREDAAIRSDQERIRREYAQATFDCTVCQDTHPEDDLAVIEGCGHKFCRIGTKDYVVSQIGEGRYPIQCPTCQGENVGAEGTPGCEFSGINAF